MTYTLVTGACGGLGGAFVKELARRGEPLYLTGRSEPRLAALAQQIKNLCPEAVVKYSVCDLSDESFRRLFFNRTDGEGITFNRLIYAAGADIQKPFEKYTEEKIAFQTRVNFEGAVSFVRAFLDRSPLDGKTEILAVGSVSGLYPMPYFALYSATKKALWQFFAALRVELKHRAKVTCVCPGAMPTREDIVTNIHNQGLWGRLAALPPEVVARKSLKAVKRNRRSVVIGFWNKFMRAVTAPLPLDWKMRFIAKKWKRWEKDAF